MSTTSIKTGRPCCQNIPIPYKVKFRINGIIRKALIQSKLTPVVSVLINCLTGIHNNAC